MFSRKMLRIFIYLALGVVVVLVYAKHIERKSLFFPVKFVELTPKAIGLSYDDIYFVTEDGKKINAWLVPSENAKYTILFFHGNAGNIGYRLDKIKILNGLGLNVFIIDYRGYGKSQGQPSEAGLYLDAKAAYNYMVDTLKMQPSSIIVYGESLGGAVALYTAARCKVRGAVTEEAFSSLRSVAKEIYPFIPSFFVSDGFNSLSTIKKVNVPKLIIHSKDDEMIPFNNAQELYDAASGKKELAVISGSHNSAFKESEAEYKNYIGKFVEELK